MAVQCRFRNLSGLSFTKEMEKEKKEKTEETIQYIGSLIRDSEQNGEKLYYTIKSERFGNTTVIAKRKEGENNFYNDMAQAISSQERDAIIVELFTGRSKRVIDSVNKFHLQLKENSLGMTIKKEPEVLKAENQIPVERYMNEQLALKSQALDHLFDKKILEYDLKVKGERIIELEKEVKEKDEYIEQLEEEIEQKPKGKLGLGGIHLGELGTYITENLLRRNPAILKSALRLNDEQLAGLWADDEPRQIDAQQSNPVTVKVKAKENLTEEQKKHNEVVEQIAEFLRGIPSTDLRKVYEILVPIDKDRQLADKLIVFINELKQKKNAV